MAICHSKPISQQEAILASEGEDDLDLIVGDAPIARFIFGSAAKRRSVEKLKQAGWPIFDVAGKNAARRSRLRDEVVEREKRASMAAHQGEAA
jgi:hypothetical protein